MAWAQFSRISPALYKDHAYETGKSYQDAGYFARNLRAVEVLIDQDVVRRGSPPDEPWKLYDLGHGHCSYDFFDQCPHRMAFARCDFYVPKRIQQGSEYRGESKPAEAPAGDPSQ